MAHSTPFPARGEVGTGATARPSYGRAQARAARRWAGYFRDALLDRLLPVREIRRAEPVRINFVFHTERVAEAPSFDRLLDFVTAFHRATGVRPTLCLLTPECPKVQVQMERTGIDSDVFTERIGRLLEHAEAGYHGHYFEITRDEECARKAYREHFGRKGAYPGPSDGSHRTWMIPVSHLNPRHDLAEAQMDRELAWLARVGIRPRTFTAGWWHMDAQIASMLAARGITVDCSIRRRHANSFGARYLAETDIPPRGEPFLLPPTSTLLEVQSIFYPVDHPFRLRASYAAIAAHAPERPLFVALPSHEGELFTHARFYWDHIRRISGSSAFTWREVSTFEGEIRRAWPEKFPEGSAA